MKHLSKFKTFENVNTDDWGVLLDVLQSDIFDEWDIQKIKGESFDGSENDPDYKLWAFRTAGGKLSTELMSNVNVLTIYNIPVEESENFWHDLIQIKLFLSEIISSEIVIIEEAVFDVYSDSHTFNDYDIKLVSL
jgi:hypothetical protein